LQECEICDTIKIRPEFLLNPSRSATGISELQNYASGTVDLDLIHDEIKIYEVSLSD